MLDENEISKVSKVFEAIGNPVRFKIVMLVNESDRPLHIKAVAKILRKDYAAVYRHVKVLEKSGLLTIYEVGRSRVLQAKNAELLKNWLKQRK